MAAETLFASPEIDSGEERNKLIACSTPIDLICNGIWSHLVVCVTAFQVFIQ